MGLRRIFMEETLETGVCCRELEVDFEGKADDGSLYNPLAYCFGCVLLVWGGVFQNFRWGPARPNIGNYIKIGPVQHPQLNPPQRGMNDHMWS
jgi:hypothetical protein